MNKQRSVIYEQRRAVLEGQDLLGRGAPVDRRGDRGHRRPVRHRRGRGLGSRPDVRGHARALRLGRLGRRAPRGLLGPRPAGASTTSPRTPRRRTRRRSGSSERSYPRARALRDPPGRRYAVARAPREHGPPARGRAPAGHGPATRSSSTRRKATRCSRSSGAPSARRSSSRSSTPSWRRGRSRATQEAPAIDGGGLAYSHESMAGADAISAAFGGNGQEGELVAVPRTEQRVVAEKEKIGRNDPAGAAAARKQKCHGRNGVRDDLSHGRRVRQSS